MLVIKNYEKNKIKRNILIFSFRSLYFDIDFNVTTHHGVTRILIKNKTSTMSKKLVFITYFTTNQTGSVSLWKK